MEKRNINIDVIKGLAILSVIILHTLNGRMLLKIGAPLHIWQAVPVFMILQGLNNGSSFQRRQFEHLSDFIKPTYYYEKFKRLLFPYFIFFVFQTMFLKINTPNYFDTQNHLQRFLTGGRGPGSYFIPLVIQTQILLPFIYTAGRKNIKRMLISTFILSLLLEIWSFSINMDGEVYRILIIRFVFALALGIALSLTPNLFYKNRIFNLLVLISGVYIVGVMYLDWNFIMEKYWHSQHAIGFFWPLFLVIFLQNINMVKDNIFLDSISLLGKASYHIFLAQLFYFWKPITQIMPQMSILPALVVNILICSLVGLLFYHFEAFLWRKLN